MHIILGLLGTIITILVLLNRLAETGIDLGGLNPFLWRRRRKWRKQYEGNPVFKVDKPMDATAILMLATAKADGDITTDAKALILQLFESEFRLSAKDASDLLISSSHLLGKGTEVRGQVKQFLTPSKSNFTDAQADSAITLIQQIAELSAHPNALDLAGQVSAELAPDSVPAGTWK